MRAFRCSSWNTDSPADDDAAVVVVAVASSSGLDTPPTRARRFGSGDLDLDRDLSRFGCEL